MPVLGMTCASCQHHVEEALRSTDGVESARVDLMGHRATVVFDPEKAVPEALVSAIRGAGAGACSNKSAMGIYLANNTTRCSARTHSSEVPHWNREGKAVRQSPENVL